MTNPPDDEGLHLVRRDEPEPRLLYTAVSKAEPQKPEKETREPALADVSTFFSLGRISIIGGIVLFIVLFVVGSGHLIEWLHKEVVTVGAPETPTASSAATVAPGSLVTVTDDMLRVTSIALGEVHLAVVNGKRLAEGDSLDVKTPSGIATLRVTSIKDGVVHFDHDGQTIDAKLRFRGVTQESP